MPYRKILLLILYPLIFACTGYSQTDVFEGSWGMEYFPPGEKNPIRIELNIGPSEKNLLYPAGIKLWYNDFSATYHLLLVKRNIRQLAIGRNKIAASEEGFAVGNWNIYLNGILDLSRDLKGAPMLTCERLATKDYGVNMVEPKTFPAGQQVMAAGIRDFLKEADIRLKKTSSIPLQNSYNDSILNPSLSPAYFGIQDTIIVNKRNGTASFTGNKKTDNGVVSLVVNNATVIDQNDLTIQKPVEDIRLDTGLNILIFFADKYGKSPATTGKIEIVFPGREFSLDFGNEKNVAATFIVAKIYYEPGKEPEVTALQNSITKELSEADLQRDIKTYYYPNPEKRNLLKSDSARVIAEKTLLRNAKPVGNIQTTTRKIIMAIWDDAVEDGDSISLNINGNWVVQGFAVKKRPQFISVTLDPGSNKIIFIADNLGSIVPNTSVLEIIDGKQRRSFMIDTDLGTNNLINITYDLKAPD